MVSSLSVRIARKKEKKIATDEKNYSASSLKSLEGRFSTAISHNLSFLFPCMVFSLHTPFLNDSYRQQGRAFAFPAYSVVRAVFSPESLMVNSGQWQVLNLGHQLGPKATFGEV